ncbi:MAG: glycosyltransferase family 2 protein [Leptolyngbyaceae cyanobacterium bins.302]|nr:glycosyltransferase family 2 protein [Leptolyngbyaceae cyanobacterium bins.302]
MIPEESLLTLVDSLLVTIAALLLIPSLILFVECFAALFPSRKSSRQPGADQPQVNVLIPAHNEEAGIGLTIAALLPQLKPTDQVIVVADNCTDSTASAAREAGAIVIERHNLELRGKGYALDFGVRFMEDNPPDVVVIVDADCIVAPGSLAQLAQSANSYHRPIQSVYLAESPANPSPKAAISALAFTVKNWVRLAGLYNLGMPALLTGTGMAMPWDIIQQAHLASSNIVEDMNLGIDLAIAGYSPLFCPNAYVNSILPQKEHAAKQQRTRWEHGHMQTMLTQAPRLLKAALRQRRFDLFVLGLDMLVPPLSLLVMVWLLTSAIALIGVWLGASPLPAFLLGVTGGMIAVAILSAWAKYCRKQLPARTLLMVPLYVLWKIPLYFAFMFKRQKAWVRTERDIIPQKAHD